MKKRIIILGGLILAAAVFLVFLWFKHESIIPATTDDIISPTSAARSAKNKSLPQILHKSFGIGSKMRFLANKAM